METASVQALPCFRRYANHNGHSGVVAYALVGRTGIAVQFAGGGTYLYDRTCPGREHVARMRGLARAGKGLATYISRRVGRRYAARLDAAADIGAFIDPRYETRQKTAFR